MVYSICSNNIVSLSQLQSGYKLGVDWGRRYERTVYSASLEAVEVREEDIPLSTNLQVLPVASPLSYLF